MPWLKMILWPKPIGSIKKDREFYGKEQTINSRKRLSN
jgi:hypothetical protein